MRKISVSIPEVKDIKTGIIRVPQLGKAAAHATLDGISNLLFRAACAIGNKKCEDKSNKDNNDTKKKE